MAYDEGLAERVRAVLEERVESREKAMFGGIAWMVRGNMACGIVGDDLMVRVGTEAHDHLVAEPHARPMDFTGRPMKGYLYVASEGTAEEDDLARWVDRALAFAMTLPAK